MLVSRCADATLVVSGILAKCSLVCCALVLGSFGYFAFGQASGASKGQVAELNQPGAGASSLSGVSTSRPAQPTYRAPSQPRRFIDGADRLLTTPFRSLLGGDSQWPGRISTTVLALLAYGLGLGYLARWARV